jgi:hypothetical protein
MAEDYNFLIMTSFYLPDCNVNVKTFILNAELNKDQAVTSYEAERNSGQAGAY